MKLTNKLLLTLTTLAASYAMIPLASANTMQVTMNYGSRHAGDGGEFNVTSTDSPLNNPLAMGYDPIAMSAGGFETFCVEANEYFNPGGTYYYGISQGAVNGGISGGNPDPLSLGTAWLYTQFAHGTLAGFNYSTGSGGDASAGDLQNTVWWLEGELSADPGNAFSAAVVSHFGSAAAAMADNNGFFGVAILNLWLDAGHTQVAQDQLVLVPDGGATVMLLGLGLVGLVLGGRKLRRVKA